MDFTEGYLIDEEKEAELGKLIRELADNYGVHFDNKLNDFIVVFNLQFMETTQKQQYSNKYRKADTILKFHKLKGNSTIKTPTSSLEIDSELLKLLQEKILKEKISILNSPVLFGYTEKEKHIRIEKLAKQERQEEVKPFKESLNAIVRWLKGMEIFSNEVKTLRDNESAFLYDLFYLMKHKLKYNLIINWREPPDIPTNSEKRKIVINYLDRK